MVRKLFSESLTTIHAAKYCILIALIIYICASATGRLYSGSLPLLKEQGKELAERFMAMNAFSFISIVFIKNSIAIYITTCIISLWGFFPALAAIVNGLFLGWAIAYASPASYSGIAIMLVPHGVFEWPAVIIGWGVGMWKGLGYRFSSKGLTYKERFKKANIVYFTVILPLLFVAAVIEGRYHIINKLLF